MNLHFMLSNGKWEKCEDGTNELWLLSCEKATGLSRKEVLSQLAEGKEVRNYNEDWYRWCKDMDTVKKKEVPACDFPEGKDLDCGCTIYNESEIMGASFGSCCPDCYDDMSQ